VAVYVVTGPLGSGKTLLAVSRIQDALYRGCRIATNIDLKLEHIVNGSPKKRDVVRLADHPTMEDFENLGRGDSGSYDEKKFGVIVLDEAAVYLNSRSWNEKADPDFERVFNADIRYPQRRANPQSPAVRRAKLIAWLRHARKFGWDVILITQDLGSIDKQIRDGLAEHVVYCRRMDRIAVPLLSMFTRLIGFGAARMPQVHVGVVKYGTGTNAPLADRWVLWFGQEFHGAYDTRQRILGENDGPAMMLDARTAPYLWEPRGVYERAWKLILRRWFHPSRARQRHVDFQLYERGLMTYKPWPQSYQEWLTAQRATAPEGGPSSVGELGGEGEAAPGALEPQPDAA
jgi:hypothetical protein